MHNTQATTVTEYLADLPPEKREALSKVREVILHHLPEGYEEVVNWGMITYQVPLETYPDTYNGKPLMYAALAAQKNHLALYLTNVYSSPELKEWFETEYQKTDKKLDMGKSCVRFKTLADVPLDLVGQAVAKTDVQEFINLITAARQR